MSLKGGFTQSMITGSEQPPTGMFMVEGIVITTGIFVTFMLLPLVIV